MKLEVSREFAAPIDAVFATLTDIPGYPDRIPAITRCEVLTEGEVRVGTRFRETRVMFGKEAVEEMEFTELTRPRGYLLEAHSHGMHYLTRHSLESTANGTRLTLSFEGRPETTAARILSPLMGLLFKGSMKKAFAGDLDALERHFAGI